MAVQISNALIFAGAQQSFPGLAPRQLQGKFRFISACFKYRAQLNAFFKQPAQEALGREVLRRPEILGFTLWPYLHAGWDVMQRFEALSQHQQAVHSDMKALAVSPTELVLVADLTATSAGLTLVVDRAPWCFREGGLVFSQYLQTERLMSIPFAFGMQNGERVAYIGGLQGANIDSALAKYREIAKDLQGMRSRDFLLKAFQFLTYHLDVKKVLCVAEAQRHHRHAFFGTGKTEDLHLNYDEIWQEHNGVATTDGFYQLGTLPTVRPMEDIAAKNRALYRRRYALMDALFADIGTRYGKASTHTSSPLTPPEKPSA
jgi:uncharacterized protein VirK/YbjX